MLIDRLQKKITTLPFGPSFPFAMNPFKVTGRVARMRSPAKQQKTPASGNNKAAYAKANNMANEQILAPDNNRADEKPNLQEDQGDSLDCKNIFTPRELGYNLDKFIKVESYAQQSRAIVDHFEQLLNPQVRDDEKGIITSGMIHNDHVAAAYMKFKEESKDLVKKLMKVKEFKDLDTDQDYVRLDLDINKYKGINIKSHKHCIENFLHVLSQNDFTFWTFGPLYHSDFSTTHFIKTEFGVYEINVYSKSSNARLLWGQALLALLIAEYIEVIRKYSIGDETITHQMDTPKQPVEDTLIETEVTKVAQNTIITQEQDDTTNAHLQYNENLLQESATTEQLSDLAPIAERFVRIFDSTQVFNTTDTFNSQIFSLDVPNGLYAHLDSTIVSALRSFTLIKTDIELLIKINANQAQCGRYIMSHFPRYDMLYTSHVTGDNVLRMLQRDHAVVDISKSDDVYYTVKYENTIPWLPIQSDEVGTLTGGSFATVRMKTLSPVRIADTGNPTCPFQVFARLKNTVLTGMRYPLPLDQAGTTVGRNDTPIHFQMDIDNTLKDTVSAIKEIPIFGSLFGIAGKILGRGSLAVGRVFGVNQEKIQDVEKRLKYIGMINKDRPVDISHPTPLLPTPVHSYAHGRGPYSSKKLRLQPEATTPSLVSHKTINDTTNINELAQIPGLLTSFMVTTTNSQGDLLVELPVCPYDPRYANLYPSISGNEIQLPPVTFFSLMYNFYAGSLVYEFVPVKTPSHNFSIQVGFVPFNGVPGTVTEAQLQSCRWKVIDFRTSQNGQFTTPWLSNRVMRNRPFSTINYASTNNDFQNSTNNIGFSNLNFKDPGKVVVRLVNELNPTPIVSPSIEVLVFVKAHPNLRFLSPTTFLASSNNMDCNITALVRQSITNESPRRFGAASIPSYHIGNFAQGIIRYEMETSKLQDGDEQTMYGDKLTDAPGPQIQTMEDHGNILDVCRRFYLHGTYTGVFYRRTDTDTQYPPFACVPLTINSYQPLPAMSSDISRTRLRCIPNPRDTILSCFRWFRGSMNFVIHSLTNIPLEVTYLPAVDRPYAITSTNMNEEMAVFESSNTNIPLYALPMNVGPPTELLEPRLNPVLTVEVPMYTANNYIDSLAAFSGDSLDSNARTELLNNFNNLTSWYLGNLVVRGVNASRLTTEQAMQSNFKVRILSAFGDDAQFHHFMGCPTINRSSVGLRWNTVTNTRNISNPELLINDRVPSSQEIETRLISEGVESNPGPVQRIMTKEEIQTKLIAEGIESNPGPVLSKISDFIPKGLTDTFSSIAGLTSDLKNAISQPKKISESLQEAKMKGISMLEQIKSILHLYTEGVDALQITSLALTLISVFKDSSNVFSLLSALCQILHITGVFHIEAVSNAMSRFSILFANTENEEKVKHQMDNQSWTTVASIFSSIILETFFAYRTVNDSKFNVNESYVKQAMVQTFKNFNVMRSGALCILMTRVCKAIEFLYQNARKWIRGLEKYDILAEDPKFIRNFMMDYEFFMDERNLSGQSMIQKHRDRFWTTVLTAYYLKSVLATVDKKYVNSTLQAAVREVIVKANSLKSHMSAPPVRYEPYSIWYYGEPGTGKTKMMQDHLIDMCKNINCTYNGDPIYVRSPHSQWWNGYDNHPIVMIDDANGVNDPAILGRMVSEFQAMKTSAKMRLEMPRLEEKNAEMTSIVLGVCSNLKEWTSSMIVDQQAFRRRRDIVVEVVYSDQAKKFFADNPTLIKAASSLPEEVRKDNDHVKFKVLYNPSTGQENGKVMNYNEFHAHLLESHSEYHTKEVEKMLKRYTKSLALSKTLASDIMDEGTLKTALMAVILGCESTEVMAETMKRQLYELKQVTPERFNALPKHTQSLLNTMSSLPEHQAPSVANPQDLHSHYPNSSQWFKTVFLPNYQVGSFYQEFSQRYRPWTYKDVLTADSDLITSQCTICRNECSGANAIYKVCGNSVEENQHWICTECAQGFDLQNINNCPVCREDKLVKFEMDQRHWHWYSKLQHIAFQSIKDFTTPLVVTANVLWNNARVIALCTSIVALLAHSLAITYRVIKDLQLEYECEKQVSRFVDYFGVLPTEVKTVGDTIYLNCGQVTYTHREHNGSYRFEVVNPEIFFEMGKKTKKIDQPSTSTSIPPVEYFSANSSEAEEEPPRITKFETRTIDIMKLLPPVQCREEHGNGTFDFLKSIKSKFNVSYQDRNFVMNIKESGKEVQTVEVPYCRCVEPNCRFNASIMIVASKYYESRYRMWQAAAQEGEDIEEIEGEVPEAFVREAIQDVEEPEQQREPLYMRFLHYQVHLLTALKGIFVSWFEKIYEKICCKWKYIIGIMTLAFATYFGIKYYYSEEEGITLEPEHQGSGEHIKGRNHNKLNVTKTRTLTRNRNLQHEMKMSLSKQTPINIQNIKDLVMKNYFELECAGTKIYAFAFMNNYGILPRHAFFYFASLQEKGQAVVFKQGNVTEILKDRITLYCVEDNVDGDYVIFHFKRLTGKDIRHHFYSTIHDEVVYPSYAYGIDLKDQKIVPVQIVSVEQNDYQTAQPISTTWTAKINGEDVDFRYESRLTDYLVVSEFYGTGKCGSPIVNPDGKIIGLHFAGQYIGGNSYGYSYPVFQDYFTGHGLVMEKTEHQMNVTEEKPEHQMDFPNLEYYSHFPNAPYHTESSRIQKSAIASHAWDSVTFPCIQSRNDPRYVHGNTPLYDGASTIGAPTNPPEREELDMAIQAVSDELIKHMPTPAMKVPVSKEEAVSAANHINVKSMNLATSAGLPLIVDFPGKNLKSDFIQNKINANGTTTVTFSPEFSKLYDINWKLRTFGIVPEDPFWAHLKDERRKPEKLLSFGGTRVFSVSPLELVVSSRRVLLPVMDAFHSDPVRLHHAIGLSTESTDWTDMIESLRMKSDKIIQLDFSKFSDSMPWEFVRGAFKVIRNYYAHYGLLTEEIENLLETLEHNITQSLICIGNNVYRVKNGVLQGHPITSLINSIVNLIEQIYVWIRITGLPGHLFFENCAIIVMGDDVVIAVPKHFLRKYNGQTIANEFLKMNIVVTDENKNKDNVIKYQHISRLDFLSCSYRLHPYRYLYLAPTDISSIFDTALWISRNDGPFFDATIENVEQSLNNSFGHGPCIYEMYRGMLEFLTQRRFRSWFELDAIFYGTRGLPERSIIATNLGIVTGTSPKVLELLGASVGRIERATNSESESQYWSADFLKNVVLDTQGIVTGKYRCDCRYNCEEELMKRIKQVEQRTGVPREQFLPFTSQEAGTGILGRAITLKADSRGNTSTIAFKSFAGVASDSVVGGIDGMRDRVL